MEATVNYRRIELTSKMPPGWGHVCTKGTNIDSWESDIGTIVIENILVGYFSIVIAHVFLRSVERIELRLHETGVFFISCIEGDWQITNQLAHAVIKKDQYLLFSSDEFLVTPLQLPGRMSRLLTIHSNADFFSFPLKNLKEPVNATALIMDILLQLVQTSYFPQPRFFHEKLIRTLLKAAEEAVVNKERLDARFTNAELKALYKVCELIDKDFRQHHSIESLALISGMNRQKLTTGFKSLFGQTIYAYYSSKKMEMAKNLLLSNDLPIKLIAKKMGYRSTTNFSIAFRKFYGLTPGRMRRKKPD